MIFTRYFRLEILSGSPYQRSTLVSKDTGLVDFESAEYRDVYRGFTVARVESTFHWSFRVREIDS